MKKPLTDEEKIFIIYQSLEDVEELIFFNRQDKISFNKYMLYLNYLESLGKINIDIKDDYFSKRRKIIIKKK